jgi:hypothetical protein
MGRIYRMYFFCRLLRVFRHMTPAYIGLTDDAIVVLPEKPVRPSRRREGRTGIRCLIYDCSFTFS